LNAALFPSLPSPSEQLSFDETSRRESLLSPNNQPELGVTATSKTLKRNSSASAGIRQQTLNIPPINKRTSFGVASGHGRLFKVLGDFFLLAGKTEDAAIWYVNSPHNEHILRFPVIQACGGRCIIENTARCNMARIGTGRHGNRHSIGGVVIRSWSCPSPSLSLSNI
jgi:hypothetical protein